VEKEHILREIKRTAEENGGKPLGWRRFESETGITSSDWFGKHWVRWGDPLREARFEPNRLATAYDDAELLEKLAQLARKLGHVPVGDDLRIEARDDSDFSSHGAFARLGEKAVIVKRLQEIDVKAAPIPNPQSPIPNP